MIRIVVDANVILSALLGGSARFALFDPRFEFVTAEFTFQEVRKYLPYVAEKSDVPLTEIKNALLLLPISMYSKEYYQHALRRARNALKDIDPHDADILALYFVEDTYLWSEDRGFEKVTPRLRLLKTRDFF